MALSLSVAVSGYSSNNKKIKPIKSKSSLRTVSNHNARETETLEMKLQRTKTIEEAIPNLIIDKDANGVVIPAFENKRIVGNGNVFDDVKNIYDTYIQPSLDEQNERYKKKGNYAKIIDSAFDKYTDNHNQDLVKEIVVKIGDVDELNELIKNKTKDEQTEILRERANALVQTFIQFREDFPNFKIANAVIHMDESNPNLHIVGIGVQNECERGLKTRVAHSNVFKRPDKDLFNLPLEQQRKIATPENGSLMYLHNGFKDKIEERLKQKNYDMDYYKFKATDNARGTYESTEEYIKYKTKRKELEQDNKQLSNNIISKKTELNNINQFLEPKQKKLEELEEELDEVNEQLQEQKSKHEHNKIALKNNEIYLDNQAQKIKNNDDVIADYYTLLDKSIVALDESIAVDKHRRDDGKQLIKYNNYMTPLKAKQTAKNKLEIIKTKTEQINEKTEKVMREMGLEFDSR